MTSIRTWHFSVFLLVMALLAGACSGDGDDSVSDSDATFPYLEDGKYPFGYLLNGDDEEKARLKDFNVVVLDLLDAPDEDLVSELHDAGVGRVLSYLNIGALEDWREDYEDFRHLCLGTYENWEDECWMDLSDESWQNHLVEQRAAAIIAQGADGFYLDNTDVYELYPDAATRDGLLAFYQALRDAYPEAWIIMQNGAKLLLDDNVGETVQGLLDGVGFEDVSYMPDFDADEETYVERDEEEHEEVLSILHALSEDFLIFTIDYTDDPEEMLDAVERSREEGFTPFVGRVGLDDLAFYPPLP